MGKSCRMRSRNDGGWYNARRLRFDREAKDWLEGERRSWWQARYEVAGCRKKARSSEKLKTNWIAWRP